MSDDTQVQTLTDFLLARIGEDEQRPPSEYAAEGQHQRLLAEADSRRRILALHGGDYDGECQSPAHLDGPCRTLRYLALPYAAHPDYRQEWKP